MDDLADSIERAEEARKIVADYWDKLSKACFDAYLKLHDLGIADSSIREQLHLTNVLAPQEDSAAV